MPPVDLPAGRYLMQINMQVFDFEQDGDGQAYPSIKTFVGGTAVATTWGGGAEMVNRAIVRGGSGTYQAGANVIITSLG